MSNPDSPDAPEAAELPDEHVVLPRALSGVELPASTMQTLLTAGVPRELRIKGWPGPALFHSELASGMLVSTATKNPLVHRDGEAEGYVFGSVRQTPESVPFSVFVLRRGSGEVWLLDLEDPERDCFANGSLDAFMASMLALHGAFDHVLGVNEEREKHVASFRALLEKLDARALAEDSFYWPGWLEAML